MARHLLRVRWRLLAASAILFTSVAADAQTYPIRPVRLVLGYPPGGGIDVAARILAPRLTDYFGQQFVVDNRPGASGNIGADIVAEPRPMATPC